MCNKDQAQDDFYNAIEAAFPRMAFQGVLFEYDEWDSPDPEYHSRFFAGYDWRTFPIDGWEWHSDLFHFLSPDGFRQFAPLLLRMAWESSELGSIAIFCLCSRIGAVESRATLSPDQLQALVPLINAIEVNLGEEGPRDVSRLKVRLNAILTGTFRD